MYQFTECLKCGKAKHRRMPKISVSETAIRSALKNIYEKDDAADSYPSEGDYQHEGNNVA
jgi:hypothetical protein